MSDEQSTAPVAETAPEEVVEEGAEEAAAEEVEAVEEAPKSTRRKFSFQVNNKMRDLEVDPNNEEEIKGYLQKAMAADEKFQEAAMMRKAVEELVRELKTNPKAVLAHEAIGLNLKEFAQQIINEEMEELEKSPEQKKIEEMERKLRDYEEEKTRLSKEKEEAERAAMRQEQLEQLDNQISDALQKSDLPKSPYVVKRIADTMYEAVKMGYTDVTVDQILPFVEEQITGELNRLFEAAPEQTASKLMEKWVGKSNLDRYRKGKVAKMKKPTEMPSKLSDTGNNSKKEEAKTGDKKMRFKDMFGSF